MKFCDKTKPLYIKTDASGVHLRAALLQTRDNMTCHKDEVPDNSILMSTVFASKSLTRVEKRFSNIEREALGILYSLGKFHHYYFAKEVSIITYHKPLIIIFKKDVATLSQRLQQILLSINQCRDRILYKPRPDLFTTDWLSWQNHKEIMMKKLRACKWHQCHMVNYKCAKVYDSQQTKEGDIPGQTLPVTEGIHHTRMARQQTPITTSHQNILDIQR